MILDYFLEIYSTEQSSAQEFRLEGVNPRISPEMNNKLLEALREDEVRIALKHMHPTKPPGTQQYVPDLLPKIFGFCGV